MPPFVKEVHQVEDIRDRGIGNILATPNRQGE